MIVLNGLQKHRLNLLINTAKSKGISGCILDNKIVDWTEKLSRNQWIPGTPWNIPQSHKAHIAGHVNNVISDSLDKKGK